MLDLLLVIGFALFFAVAGFLAGVSWMNSVWRYRLGQRRFQATKQSRVRTL